MDGDGLGVRWWWWVVVVRVLVGAAAGETGIFEVLYTAAAAG